MNSIPASSSARLTRPKVSDREGGMPLVDSNLLMVAQPTPLIFDNSFEEMFSSPRAALICEEET